MSPWKPRTIRSQLLAGLILFEMLSLALFSTLLVRQQMSEVRKRISQRMAHQATSLASQASLSFLEQDPQILDQAVKMMAASPSVASAKVSDPSGQLLSASPEFSGLTAYEKQQLHGLTVSRVFQPHGEYSESVAPVFVKGELKGYAWIYTDEKWDGKQLHSLLRVILIYGAVWIVVSAVLTWLVARSLTRPLATLLKGTRSLIRHPESNHNFPLPVTSQNEIADLTSAFNLMVASIEEQRAGLNDTLALLDSMLANAPIGFAFFDRRCRFVRVNRFFAELNGMGVGRYLGRTVPELLPSPVAQQLEDALIQVFETGKPLQNLELSGEISGQPRQLWSWLTNVYPVRTSTQQVRWVGVIVMDTSERKRSEDALRKTEKLAAVGRLAASIAHEINNPLEAVTNLLFLLRMHSSLDETAQSYAQMAQHEVSRVSEITQQTLRFYRQSTLPVTTNVGELIDSVLKLHQGRLNALNVNVERQYGIDVQLFCFAGELRQVFANLIGNAIDAMPSGGRLRLRVSHAQSWKNPRIEGVRIVVADTGYGMDRTTQKHIFEPFFTTKDVTGTGLGLWISQEIIQKHSGKVRVRSRTANRGETSGTVFMLFFPIDQNALETPSRSQGAPVLA